MKEARELKEAKYEQQWRLLNDSELEGEENG